MSHVATPVGGRLLTPFYKLLLGFIGLGALLTLWRFWSGLGPATGLNDGFPWGLWIAFDVVTGTALACGGYAVALLVYVFNRGQYHPLVRPAVLTSALGYSVAALAIMIDVGRPWFIWRIPISPTKWNLNSALLEVALCVMSYIVVLWLELAPAFLEKWSKEGRGSLAERARAISRGLDKALPFLLALGLLLPTMHQSSLGTVMLLGGAKLHALWNTPFLPLLFLISCLSMGYAAVVIESSLASLFFKRKPETTMLAKLSRVAAWSCLVFLAIRFIDLTVRGRSGLLFGSGWLSFFFWLETATFLIPALIFFRAGPGRGLGRLLQGALLLAFAGSLYRFDTYLIAFDPGGEWSYFPTLTEMLITLGIIAVEIAVYVWVVRRFPILAGDKSSLAGATEGTT